MKCKERTLEVMAVAVIATLDTMIAMSMGCVWNAITTRAYRKMRLAMARAVNQLSVLTCSCLSFLIVNGNRESLGFRIGSNALVVFSIGLFHNAFARTLLWAGYLLVRMIDPRLSRHP